MKTPLAWRNVMQKKARAITALCGVSFAILLMFMQLGFRAAAATSATNVYDALDFDVMVLSRQYVSLAHSAKYARSLLEQVRGAEGVASAIPVWIGLGEWRGGGSRDLWNVIVLGVDPEQRPFRSAALNARLPSLGVADTALSDSLSRPEHGSVAPGVTREVEYHRVRIVGQYRIGAGFTAGATMVTGRETFLRIFGDADDEKINAGLVKLLPHASPEATVRDINRRLWPEATAVTREDMVKSERRYWLEVKPIGIMFTAGVVIAFVAGAVVVYQVLSSEVQIRLREFATMKALGYGDRDVYGVVVRQALIFAGLGFVPAFLLALGLYDLLRTQALVPVTMELGRVAGVAGLTALFCLSATFFAARKLQKAAPADLF